MEYICVKSLAITEWEMNNNFYKNTFHLIPYWYRVDRIENRTKLSIYTYIVDNFCKLLIFI